jgi:hypothetical protein
MPTLRVLLTQCIQAVHEIQSDPMNVDDVVLPSDDDSDFEFEDRGITLPFASIDEVQDSLTTGKKRSLDDEDDESDEDGDKEEDEDRAPKKARMDNDTLPPGNQLCKN